MLITSPIPLYYQVANVLRHRILDGVYHPGERIGSEMEMCREFGVSRVTLRRALAELERESLVVRRRSLGTFVSERLPNITSISFIGFLEDLLAQLRLEESRKVEVDQVSAPEKVGRALQLQPGETVARLERVRFLEGDPLAYTVNYLPLSIGSAITAEDLQEHPMTHLLERQLGVPLDEAIQTIHAVLATPELAEKLAVQEGAPLLLVERVAHAAGRPVEYALTHYRADRYGYTVRLGRITRGDARKTRNHEETENPRRQQ